MTSLTSTNLQEEDDLLRRQFEPTPPDDAEVDPTTITTRNRPLTKEEDAESRDREESLPPVAIGDSDTFPPEDEKQPEAVDPKKLHPGLAAIQRRELRAAVQRVVSKGPIQTC